MVNYGTLLEGNIMGQLNIVFLWKCFMTQQCLGGGEGNDAWQCNPNTQEKV